jgi:hypothetical protein
MVVTGTRLVDQELIIHAFAPIEGPHAATAYEQIREIWNRCHHRLGTTGPIPHTGLPTELPLDPHRTLSNRALAAQEDRTADYQVIARREHDVINFSMVFAAPLDTQSRRLRIGSASPPSWIEFDRWWTELAAGGTDALLGVVRVYQAKLTDPVSEPLDVLAHEVRAALPNNDHEPYWWQRGRIGHHGFAVWETSPDDARPDRQIVVIGHEDQDLRLSAWTYSQGDVAMPPFARYLLHAAKLRYQARVRGDGQQIKRILQRVNDRVTLWVPNSSSTAVASSVTRVWMSGMIVDHGAATAASERPAAGAMAWPSGLCSRPKNQQAPDKGERSPAAKIRHDRRRGTRS